MTLSAHSVSLAGRLHGVSVDLHPGAVVAICGPNGAGKSSLLQVLAGLLPADGGEVRLEGQPLRDLHPRQRARAIGYLPQTGEVAWDVSVSTLVALGRAPHGDTGERQVHAAMEAADLLQIAHRPVSTLSGGERARALLARVLAGEPRWVLADEPLASLDLAHQLVLLETMRAAAVAHQAGVVLVLHDLALAMNHADRVLVLDGGRVVADDRPANALSEAIVARVWGVSARWLGEAGRRALAMETLRPV